MRHTCPVNSFGNSLRDLGCSARMKSNCPSSRAELRHSELHPPPHSYALDCAAGEQTATFQRSREACREQLSHCPLRSRQSPEQCALRDEHPLPWAPHPGGAQRCLPWGSSHRRCGEGPLGAGQGELPASDPREAPLMGIAGLELASALGWMRLPEQHAKKIPNKMGRWS